MEEYKFQLAETIILIIVFLITRLLTKRIIEKIGARFNYQSARIKITKKIVGVLFLMLFTLILMLIWSVDQSELIVFLSTILTILGIAFFAQWSIISNITSTLIIFFNYPIKIGEFLTIMDKDYQIEGKLSDIGIFFITIKTKENKKVTMPSNVFMQKMVQKNESDPVNVT